MTVGRLADPGRGLRLAARVAAGLAVLATLVGGLVLAARAVPAQAPASPAPGPQVAAGVAAPARLEIPAIGVDARLVPVGLRPDGAMEVPPGGLAGWYEPGPRPGQTGPAVLVGHVDSKHGPDVFYRLRELRPGDAVLVSGGGVQVSFVVRSTEQVAKDRLPVEAIWNDADEPVLRLITCGGSFDRASGHYRDNVVVYASLTDADDQFS